MKVEFCLVPDPTDDEFFFKEPEIQSDLAALDDFMATAYARDFQPRVWIQKSSDGGTWATGQFILTTAKDLAPLIGPAIGLLGGWLIAKAGRKVRMKIGNHEFEAHSVEEIRRLIELTKERK